MTTFAGVFTPERRAAFAKAVRKYWESVPPLMRIEHATQDGLKKTTISSWMRGSSRSVEPVVPNPTSLLKLYEVSGDETFLLSPQEIAIIDAIQDYHFVIPDRLRELAGAKQAGTAPPVNVKPFVSKKKTQGSLPAYTLERLGEIADAAKKYYQYVLKNVPAQDRDEFFKNFQKMSWLREHPQERKIADKKTVGYGPDKMLELYRRTKDPTFILSPEEVRRFQERKDFRVAVPEQMLRLSAAFESGKKPSEVYEPEKARPEVREQPERAVLTAAAPMLTREIFSAKRVDELAGIIRAWVSSLGTIEDPVDDRFETRAARILGLSTTNVLLLKMGRMAPTPELLAQISAVFPHERLRLTDEERAAAVAAGVVVPEYGATMKAAPVKQAESEDAQLLAQMDTKVQAMLGLLEMLLSRLPETQELLTQGRELDPRSLTTLIPRQMNVLKATVLSLDALLSQLGTVEAPLKNAAIDLVWQLVKVFRLTAADFVAREPKAEFDPAFQATLDALFNRGGKR